MFENYLLKDFKNHAADLGPVLVDSCFFLVMAKQKADQQFLGVSTGPEFSCFNLKGKQVSTNTGPRSAA